MLFCDLGPHKITIFFFSTKLKLCLNLFSSRDRDVRNLNFIFFVRFSKPYGIQRVKILLTPLKKHLD